MYKIIQDNDISCIENRINELYESGWVVHSMDSSFGSCPWITVLMRRMTAEEFRWSVKHREGEVDNPS